jgi:hypothetical protein
MRIQGKFGKKTRKLEGKRQKIEGSDENSGKIWGKARKLKRKRRRIEKIKRRDECFRENFGKSEET